MSSRFFFLFTPVGPFRNFPHTSPVFPFFVISHTQGCSGDTRKRRLSDCQKQLGLLYSPLLMHCRLSVALHLSDSVVFAAASKNFRFAFTAHLNTAHSTETTVVNKKWPTHQRPSVLRVYLKQTNPLYWSAKAGCSRFHESEDHTSRSTK